MQTKYSDETSSSNLSLNRRRFLRGAAYTIATSALSGISHAQTLTKPMQNDVQLPQVKAKTEPEEHVPGPFEPAAKRTGYAIVGLGHLALGQILPAIWTCKYSKPVALVSGERDKALKVARQYGIKEDSIYNYQTYERLADNPDVQVIYIVLPNSMHAEYTIRGAKTGKHVLCEKPMATSSRDCEHMIAACKNANVKLMVAYRSQYEPMDRAIVKMVQEKKLGTLQQFISSNSQNQGDPTQWRLKKAMSGGGPLPDVGVYCLNAARFLSGAEPEEVVGTLFQPKDDPRFAEVEESCSFLARFPGGYTATCACSYGAHHSQFFRLEGDQAFAEMNPAYGYTGLKMRWSKLDDGREDLHQPSIKSVDQFATEMDHMSLCVQQNIQPHTPGEEGLQDQRIIEAIYESAREGKPVKIAPPAAPTRGPEPLETT